MPPDSSEVFVRARRRQVHHFQLGERHFVEQLTRQIEVLPDRELHVPQHREGGEQRALLEQGCPNGVRRCAGRSRRRRPGRREYLDQPLALRQQPMIERINTTFRRPRRPRSEDLAAEDIEREPVEHRRGAGGAAKPTTRSRTRITASLPGSAMVPILAHIPIEAKNMANMPSSRITRKIDFTTESVS